MPGPTTIPDEVLLAMHRQPLDIYGEEMIELTETIFADLARLFKTSRRPYVYCGNGHSSWEAALTNLLSKDELVLVLDSGLFPIVWGDTARNLGLKVEVLKGLFRLQIESLKLKRTD